MYAHESTRSARTIHLFRSSVLQSAAITRLGSTCLHVFACSIISISSEQSAPARSRPALPRALPDTDQFRRSYCRERQTLKGTPRTSIPLHFLLRRERPPIRLRVLAERGQLRRVREYQAPCPVPNVREADDPTRALWSRTGWQRSDSGCSASDKA